MCIFCSSSFIGTQFNGLKTTLTSFNIFTNGLWAYTVQSKYMHKSHAFEEAIFQTKLKLKHENKQSDTAGSQSPIAALAKDFFPASKAKPIYMANASISLLPFLKLKTEKTKGSETNGDFSFAGNLETLSS